MDKCTCQSTVGNQWYVQIDGCTTNLVAVGKLMGSKILRNVHYHVDLVLMQQIECLWLGVVRWPVYQCVGNAVVGKVL